MDSFDIDRLNLFGYFSCLLAWSNTKSNVSVSDDGRFVLKESGWPRSVLKRTERGIVLDTWRFAFSFSSCFNSKESSWLAPRNFQTKIPSAPYRVLEGSKISLLMGVFSSFICSLSLCFSHPFYANEKEKRKKQEKIVHEEKTILSTPFCLMWICILKCTCDATQTNFSSSLFFSLIQFIIINNYYYQIRYSSYLCTLYRFSLSCPILVDGESGEIPSWVNIDWFTVILVTPQQR